MYLGCRGGIFRGVGTWDAEVECTWDAEVECTWDAEVECTWDAEVEVAVAPPARKTFFCTFGAMSRLKKVYFMFSCALNMIS